MTLTIGYFTNRKDCRINWFFDSLIRQAGDDYPSIRVVVVDFYSEERGNEFAQYRTPNVIWTSQKPTPWQGRHRLTSKDYFAASNARNTAICHAPDGKIAFVDDLSVLSPDWYDCVRHAMIRPEITLGRYRKVRNLVVEDGLAVSYDESVGGADSRYQPSLGSALVRCPGSWLYGCSFVASVEQLLTINGACEDCDSMGTEDTAMGVMLEKQGFGFVYDQRMLTLESEELHHVEPAFVRLAKEYVPGVSTFKEKDAAHAYIGFLNRGRKRAPNTFDLRELRQHILSGGSFSTDVQPHNDWRDGTHLSTM